MAFRRLMPISHRRFQAPKDGRLEIEKRSYFGGPCFEGTLRNNLCLGGLASGRSFALNEVPWPERFEGDHALSILRCRAATRVAKNARLATHLLSVHCL